MAPGIVISNLSVLFPDSAMPALRDLSMTAAAGSITAVLGPTDAGKSTLFHALSGVLGSHHRPASASGAVRIGTDTFAPIPDRILFPRVALAMQDPLIQLSGIQETVEREIGFGLENIGIPPDEVASRVRRSLHNFGLQLLAQRHPRTLSGGELQRVVLASILVAEPEVLLLDEPATALDSGMVVRLASLLAGLKGSCTILFSDTQPDLALAIADNIVILENGAMSFAGRPGEFLARLPELANTVSSDAWIDLIRSSSRTQRGLPRRVSPFFPMP